MRFFAALLLLASASAYAAEPDSHPTQTEKVRKAPKAPQSLAIIACRADDLTGQPGRHGVDEAGNYDETSAARDWRDLELRITEGAYQCKREILELEDAVAANHPRKPYSLAGVGSVLPTEDNPQAPVTGELYTESLDTDFGNPTQCARIGIWEASDWNAKHKGWAVVGVGCPTPMMSDAGTPETKDDDYLVGWKLPECPGHMPGTRDDQKDPESGNRMRCDFDESAI